MTERIEANIVKHLQKACESVGCAVASVPIEIPSHKTLGDITTSVAFTVAKKLSCSPQEAAEKIIAALSALSFVSAIVAKNGFINFSLSRDTVLEAVFLAHKDSASYGAHQWKSEEWLLEHTSANPNKAMHVGHLRNNVLGMAIANIAEFLGARVTRDYVSNDRGIAIARLMWGYLKFARKDGQEKTDLSYWHTHRDEWHTPESAKKRADIFVDELYVLGSKDFEERPDVEAIVRSLVVAWEKNDEPTRALWELVMMYSQTGQELTLKRLGSKIDKVWYEHDHYQLGKELVAMGLKKGVFKKLDDGAILTDLSSYGLPDTIVAKADGTSLYITQDIALTQLKQKAFRPDKMLWVVGVEQSTALAQVFAICEQLGIGPLARYTHISYGWMSIKGQGSMSSRAGNVIYIDQLIDVAKEKILKKIDASRIGNIAPQDVAECVALAAVKYSILRVGKNTNVQFDIDTSVSFEGDSGPYLQYTYARIQSIRRKGQKEGIGEQLQSSIHAPADTQEIEHSIREFPWVVARSGNDLAPHYLCTYLNELAQLCNTYYGKQVVINKNDEHSAHRMAVLSTAGLVLRQGLLLLGIETLEQM